MVMNTANQKKKQKIKNSPQIKITKLAYLEKQIPNISLADNAYKDTSSKKLTIKIRTESFDEFKKKDKGIGKV